MKPYCTQNNEECETCSLKNYGMDCKNNPIGQGGPGRGQGRKPVSAQFKKEHSKARISKWVLDWLDARRDEGSRGAIIEAALIKVHKLKAPPETNAKGNRTPGHGLNATRSSTGRNPLSIQVCFNSHLIISCFFSEL